MGTFGKAIKYVQKTVGREELYYIFIPILIFESGYNSNLFMFKRNLKPILFLAFPGVLLSTFLFAICLYQIGFGQKIPFSGLLVISSILGSTDPVAVCSLLTELGTPHKLNIMLEGEALLNDGVAVVIFQTVLEIYNFKDVTFFRIICNTISLCVGGAVIGYLFGQFFLSWIKNEANGYIIVCITFINCFLLFFVCEYFFWELSGILAVVVSSVVLSSKGKINMIENDLHLIVDTVWQFAKFVTESILFIFTGLFIGKEFTQAYQEVSFEFLVIDIIRVIFFFFIMNFCRLIVILLFLPFMNNKKNKHEYKITIKDCVLIAYSGIRGAFPLIICLGFAKNPNYDEHFRRTAILITIGTIFMGMIFNGLTLKFLVKILKIKNQKEYNLQVKNLIKKEMFLEIHKKFQQIKLQTLFSVVNWSLVYELSGLKSEYKDLKSIEKNKPKSEHNFSKSFLLKTTDILVEFRIRIIYNFKALVYSNLKEAHLSSESATMLIETCDCALEETENKLNLWFHLEELLVEDFFTKKILFKLKNVDIIYNIIKKNYIVKLCSFYEASNGFIDYLNIIKNNKENERGISSTHFNYILNEINFNIKKATIFLEKLIKDNSVLVQLYQTKLATREILYNKKKIIKQLKLHGIVKNEEIKNLLKKNQESTLKINNFGIKMDKIFISEIIKSNFFFSLLDSKDINEIIINKILVYKENKEYLFRKKMNSNGVFLILSGSVTVYYGENNNKIKLIGNLLGMSSLLNNDFLYDCDIICNTRCSFLKMELSLLQEFINKYKSFENNLFLFFFIHKLNFFDYLKKYYFDKCSENLIFLKKKGKEEILLKGFFLVKGNLSYKLKLDNIISETFYISGWHLEENVKNQEILIKYETDCVLIIFEDQRNNIFDRNLERVRKGTFSHHQSNRFYTKGQNIEKEFDEIEEEKLF